MNIGYYSGKERRDWQMILEDVPVTVVTGVSSGIGRAIAIYLAGSGHTVYGTVRSFDKAAKLNTMQLRPRST